MTRIALEVDFGLFSFQNQEYIDQRKFFQSQLDTRIVNDHWIKYD